MPGPMPVNLPATENNCIRGLRMHSVKLALLSYHNANCVAQTTTATGEIENRHME